MPSSFCETRPTQDGSLRSGPMYTCSITMSSPVVIDLASVALKRPPLGPELQIALNLIPAQTWYALPSGALTFVNERTADYLGLSKDHPLRYGIDAEAEWDSHIPLLHPDDHEEAR